MMVWILLTLAGGYVLAIEPHLSAARKRLADHWAFFRGMTSCIPCSSAWPGAFAAAALHENGFVPAWFERAVPWFVTDAVVPIVAFFCGMAIGYVVEAISPMTATVYAVKVQRGKTES